MGGEVVERHSEHAHRLEQARQLVANELRLQLVEDSLPCVRRDGRADTGLVLDDLAVAARTVTLVHCVWIQADVHRELAYRWNALTTAPLGRENSVAYLVRDLLVDPLGLTKLHRSPAFLVRAAKRATSRR